MLDPALAQLLPRTCEVRDGVLHLGGVSVTELAATYETPVIAYDAADVTAAALDWTHAFDDYAPGAMIAYASKAFSSVGMLRLLGDLGIGADVASRGELESALRAGIDPRRIVVHGNNKSRSELEAAVAAGVGLIVVDAADELELLTEVAAAASRPQSILVRLNPDIVVETHHYINTAHAGSKFGVPGDMATELLRRAAQSPWLLPRGVHVHLGSQLLDVAPWAEVLTWLAAWALQLRDDHGIAIDVLDLGGGLGIAYTEQDTPPAPADIARTITDTLAHAWAPTGLPLPALVLEPGRSIVGRAAMTIYTVGVVKDAGEIRYVNVDGGMSDNPRPVLYQATYRALLGARMDDAPDGTWWVAGVHCESGDVLIEDAALPTPRAGDLLVVPATGAYAASMASTYNMVPRCAVVLVEDGAHRLLLRRETLDDLFARDAGVTP
ncbi:MAG: diaminopimelate decarboxylase [Thermoleophilia bacterium]|nr:diaminopimelate decarboxylase [Thermoleophilia bacterium]